MIFSQQLILFVALIGLYDLYSCHDMKGFDDSILYKINWPGGDAAQLYDPEKFESMVITTSDQEKYRCIIPHVDNKSDEEKSKYTSLSPLNFLSVIFSDSTCSFRLEAYWNYEICHGFHVRQYHDERDSNSKQTKTQEFFLGRWDDTKMEKLKEKVRDDLQSGRKYPHTKIDNVKYPYFEMEMTDGTLCDLNNEPRVTRVRYICYPHGKNEIYSLKETSTCNYEAIILTTALCIHPAFLPEESLESPINCLPLEDSPDKPFSWLVNKVDDMKHRYKQISEVFKHKENIAIIKVDPKDGTLRMDFINTELDEKFINPEPKKQESITPASNTPKPLPTEKNSIDFSAVVKFLRGEECWRSGSGWWKYEYCYGKSVSQYHGKETIVLGYFDEKLHKEWLKKNPEKRPAPKKIRTDISHLYQGGSYCEKIGEKRKVEVRLKCAVPISQPVTMFLLEPKTCQYILIVESLMICDMLPLVDEDGLLSDESVKIIGSKSEKASDSRGNSLDEKKIFEDIEARFGND